jgi:hypothetical protein
MGIMDRTLIKAVAALAAFCALALAPRQAQADCGVSVGDFDGNGVQDLKVVGPGGTKQRVVIDVGDASTTVSLDCNGDGDFVDASLGDLNAQVFAGSFYSYNVQLGGGDIITINIPSMTSVAKALQVTLGPGTNTVTINGAGATLSANSRMTIDVAGYTQIDTLNVTLPGLDNSALAFRTDLSLGNDIANFTLGGDITNGSVMDVDVLLNLGANVFTFSQPAAQTISASTLDLTVEGSVNIDNVTTSFAGTLSNNARLLVYTDLGVGNDLYKGNFDLTTFHILSSSEARFDVLGGDGNDTIAFTRNGTSGGASAQNAGLLDLHVDGGNSDDTITVDLAGGGFQMNGGTLGLRIEGGPGNDKINVGLEAEAGSTNPIFDIAIAGLGQNDAITFALTNNSASNTAANYGPAGSVLIDGGLSANTCAVSGNGIVHRRNCN